MVCPISQGAASSARTFGMVVTLMGLGTDVQGAIHCHQMKAMDWKIRGAKFKEKLPLEIVDDVVARIAVIISD
jgi:mRNA interferase ChpB